VPLPKIWVDRSTDTTIQVLADPRLLAPLLVLLDFIFAWVVLTLAGHLLGLMGLGILRSLTLGILAFALLVPIARQVLRVRAVLRPPRSPEETRTSRKRARAIGYLAYGSLAVVLLLLGIAFFTAEGLTTLGRYLAWWLVVSGFLLIISTPFAKIIFDRYLESIYQVDGG
jgi:cytochrome b561